MRAESGKNRCSRSGRSAAFQDLIFIEVQRLRRDKKLQHVHDAPRAVQDVVDKRCVLQAGARKECAPDGEACAFGRDEKE